MTLHQGSAMNLLQNIRQLDTPTCILHLKTQFHSKTGIGKTACINAWLREANFFIQKTTHAD